MKLRMTISLIAALALLGVTALLAQDYGSPATPKIETAPPKGSIMNIVQNDTTMALFVKHANKAGLTKALEGKGPLTVFAANNDGFNARSKEDIDAEHKEPGVLESTMKYHVIRGKSLTSADLIKMNGQTLTMDNGMKVPIVVQDGHITVGSAHIIGNDIVASNGVIHVVDHVLIPGKEMTVSAKTPTGK
jgi:uncharacterized surface protein with fasciclin (FAS1) repeats